MRVLVAGVGYRDLCDHSFGTVLADRLAARDWPAHVSIEDLSYNPIAVVQRLEDDPPARRFSLAVFIGAVRRPGRPPGTVSAYRWDNALPGPDDIHGAISDAVTGVIALDNTLVIGRHFQALPEAVAVVEVEPLRHEFGDTLSAPVQQAVEPVVELVTGLALDPASVARLSIGRLGGEGPRYAGFMAAQVSHGRTPR